MNKRIKELADSVPGSHDASDEFCEKFAELIVKECMEQLVKEGDAWEQFSRNPPEGQETNASAALFAAYRLKEDAVARLEKHFGVEE
jgi:hypothetical protein